MNFNLTAVSQYLTFLPENDYNNYVNYKHSAFGEGWFQSSCPGMGLEWRNWCHSCWMNRPSGNMAPAQQARQLRLVVVLSFSGKQDTEIFIKGVDCLIRVCCLCSKRLFYPLLQYSFSIISINAGTFQL